MLVRVFNGSEPFLNIVALYSAYAKACSSFSLLEDARSTASSFKFNSRIKSEVDEAVSKFTTTYRDGLIARVLFKAPFLWEYYINALLRDSSRNRFRLVVEAIRDYIKYLSSSSFMPTNVLGDILPKDRSGAPPERRVYSFEFKEGVVKLYSLSSSEALSKFGVPCIGDVTVLVSTASSLFFKVRSLDGASYY